MWFSYISFETNLSISDTSNLSNSITNCLEFYAVSDVKCTCTFYYINNNHFMFPNEKK